MDLEKWFFPDQVPGQMLYLGEARSVLLSRGKDGKWRYIDQFPHCLSEVDSISSLPGAAKGPLGLSVNPNPFVFNLFNFDTPLPVNSRKRNELIEWRLQRVFPDVPDDMWKTCLTFNRKTVLSTLISGTFLRSCEDHFRALGYPITYISCSTANAINKAQGLSHEPVMILEQEGQLLMVTLVKNGIPIFMRKIRFSQLDELIVALRKTMAFVSEQQGVTVEYYVVNPLGGGDCGAWLGELGELKPAQLPQTRDPFALFLP